MKSKQQTESFFSFITIRSRRSGLCMVCLIDAYECWDWDGFPLSGLLKNPEPPEKLRRVLLPVKAGSVTRRSRKWLRAGHNHDFVAVKTCPNAIRLPEPHNPNQDFFNSPSAPGFRESLPNNDDEFNMRKILRAHIPPQAVGQPAPGGSPNRGVQT